MPNGDEQQTPLERLYALKMKVAQVLQEGIDNKVIPIDESDPSKGTTTVFNLWLNQIRLEYQEIEQLSMVKRNPFGVGAGQEIGSQSYYSPSSGGVTEQDKKDFAQFIFYTIPETFEHNDDRALVRNYFGGEKVIPKSSSELYPQADLEPIRQMIYEGDVEGARVALATNADLMWRGDKNINDLIALMVKENEENVASETQLKNIATGSTQRDVAGPYAERAEVARYTTVHPDTGKVIDPETGKPPTVTAKKGYTVHDWYQRADADFVNEYKIDPQFPTHMDPDFAKKSSAYERGKDLQWDYYQTNNPVYNLMGSERKKIAEGIHTRAKFQYDMDMAMNRTRAETDSNFKNPMENTSYMTYVDDLIYGRRAMYTPQDMQKANQYITSQMAKELTTVNADAIAQKEAEDPTTEGPKTSAAITATQMIRTPGQAIDWMVANEGMKYSTAHRQGAQEILRNQLKTYMYTNYGDELTAVAQNEDVSSMNAQMGRDMWNKYSKSNYSAADMLGYKSIGQE